MGAALLAVSSLLLASCPSATVTTRDVSFDETRTAVVACGRVLHRAVLMTPPRRRPRGAIVGGAAAAGRRVVWIETRFRAGRRTVVLVSVRGPAIRRTLLRRDRSPLVPSVDVVSTDRGELAWLAPAGRDRASNRLVIDRPGRPPRALARVVATDLAVDDGFTLRWSAYGRGYGFHDLPRPHAPACRRRDGYHVLARNADVRVTQRVYHGEDDIDTAVVRACVRGEGPDRVILQAESGVSNSSDVRVTGLTGTTVDLSVTSSERHDPCIGGTRSIRIEARTGRTVSEAWTPRCG